MSGALEMQPRFTRGEYWLLESVVSWKLPIWRLDRASLDEVLNKEAHGMSRELLVETLTKLFAAGLVDATTAEAQHLSLTAAQVEMALDETDLVDCTTYALTSKGGAQWEAFASPHWEHYVKGWFECPNEDDPELERAEYVCQNRSTVERHFKSLEHYDFDVVQGSVQWDVLEPWQATYWKELPVGHRLRFDGRRRPESDGEWPPRPVYLNDIYDHLWYPWR